MSGIDIRNVKVPDRAVVVTPGARYLTELWRTTGCGTGS